MALREADFALAPTLDVAGGGDAPGSSKSIYAPCDSVELIIALRRCNGSADCAHDKRNLLPPGVQASEDCFVDFGVGHAWPAFDMSGDSASGSRQGPLEVFRSVGGSDRMLPPEAVRELARTKQEVKHPASARAGGLRRCVKQKRAQDECFTPLGMAYDFSGRAPDGGGGLGLDAASSVSAWHDPKWTVLRGASVEVYADRDQLFEDLRRSLNKE